MDYGTKRELRDAPLFSRVTRADQARIRAAAEAEGLSLSSYVAAAAVERASTDLGLGTERLKRPRDRPIGGKRDDVGTEQR
jgi:hypothetical protein